MIFYMPIRRTALFLKEQQLEKRQKLSEKTGAPVAELVRRAIDAYLLFEEEGTEMKKRAAIYARVSTGDQHLETQLLDLREMAKQRGYEVAHEYTDVISGTKSKRPGLDQLLADARRHRFDIVLVQRLTASRETSGISWTC